MEAWSWDGKNGGSENTGSLDRSATDFCFGGGAWSYRICGGGPLVHSVKKH